MGRWLSVFSDSNRKFFCLGFSRGLPGVIRPEIAKHDHPDKLLLSTYVPLKKFRLFWLLETSRSFLDYLCDTFKYYTV